MIRNHLDQSNLGIVLGPDGFLRLFEGRVRAPDISFIRWERFPGGKLPDEQIASIAPDLAIEILSQGNTTCEIDQKVADYFKGGSTQVWIIDPAVRTATLHCSTGEKSTISADGRLAAEKVLPGFVLSLTDLFERATRGLDERMGV